MIDHDDTYIRSSWMKIQSVIVFESILLMMFQLFNNDMLIYMLISGIYIYQ